MRRLCKSLAALFLALGLLVCLAAPASAISSGDCGIRLVKNSSFNEDGKYYLSFSITGGKPYEAWSGKSYVSAKLVNSNGASVFTWGAQNEYVINQGETKTRNYGADYSTLPSGTYTFKLKVRVAGYSEGTYGVWYNYSFEWSYTLNHTQPATVNLNSVEVVRRDDGSYANKLSFKHSGAKGQVLNLEIYDPWGSRVYSAKGSPIAYTSGTYNFYWGGYPSGGGVQCSSGEYTIKYWLDGKNAKQSKYYLSIY